MSLYAKIDPKTMNYCKIKICLDIFREMGLVSISDSCDTITKIKVEKKVDLENSNILRELRCKWGIRVVQ